MHSGDGSSLFSIVGPADGRTAVARLSAWRVNAASGNSLQRRRRLAPPEQALVFTVCNMLRTGGAPVTQPAMTCPSLRLSERPAARQYAPHKPQTRAAR